MNLSIRLFVCLSQIFVPDSATPACYIYIFFVMYIIKTQSFIGVFEKMIQVGGDNSSK